MLFWTTHWNIPNFNLFYITYYSTIPSLSGEKYRQLPINELLDTKKMID